jgi:dienelactone hydrolase
MGTAVFAPSRRGYDGAEGESVEEAVATAAFGSVIYHDLMIERLRAETEDLLIAFDLIRQQPWADPSRIVCAGYSLGAMVTIDALARESGLAAGVAFALAAIMWPASPAIRALVREQVASSCQPLMLVQAANDFSTEPSRALAPMIRSRSNASRVAVYPPHGKRPDRAHAFCASGAGTWGQDVQRFLVDAGILA